MFLVLAACGRAPSLPKLAPGDVVLAFGDSITYGTGASEGESYPAVLASLIHRPVVRAGVPGEVTAQGRERLPALLDEHSPRIVILCLGGNDMLRRLDDQATAANLRAMVRTLRERGIGVVLLGVPRPGLFSGAPEFYGKIAEEFSVPYEGSVVKSVLYSADLKSDPIHPNAAGYRRIAEALAQLLKSAGAL